MLKKRYKIRNWREYNQSLKNRYRLAMLISEPRRAGVRIGMPNRPAREERPAMDVRVPNVLVVGLDDYQQGLLARLPSRHAIRPCPLLAMERLRGVSRFDPEALLNEAHGELDGFTAGTYVVEAVAVSEDGPIFRGLANTAVDRGQSIEVDVVLSDED